MSGNRIQRQRDAFAYRFAADASATIEDAAVSGDWQGYVNRLSGEFDQWHNKQPDKNDWPTSRGINDWTNIERFLKQHYPATHRDFGMGLEEARPLIRGEDNPFFEMYPNEQWRYSPQEYKNVPSYETGPEAEAKYGYDPRSVAAAMILLHNRGNGVFGSREYEVDEDTELLNDIFQKRMQMQRNYEQRQANSYRYANDLVKEYTDQLYDEFHDWAREQEYVPVGFEKNDPRVINPDYTKQMNGPLSYWDNIEGFLKDRYPAAHRDYRYGEENASDALDGNALRMPARYSPWPNRTWHPPYETGPEAIEKYGYDPRQVAAGFMYLHTWSHAQSPQNKWRGDKLPRDIDRLAEIFQKRQQMQRDYENRTAAVVSEEDWRVPDGEEELGQDFGTAAQTLTERLQGEFDQWASDNDITEHPFERGVWEPDNPRGPIGHWPYIENFLEDNYPAAHRGLQYGMETAQPLMDGYSKLYNKSVEDRWVDLNGGPYQTGPDAVIRHGYDPKEIAAAFLYLHNRSHAFRNTDEWIDQDVDRLFDIFKKRQKMQRDYEQRQAQ